MGTIISHTIDYNGVGILKGQQPYPAKTTSSPGRFSLALEVGPTSKAREKHLGDEVAATIN